MLRRHILVAVIAFGALVPALAQDSVPASSSGPVRATGAYPVRQDANQWLGSNMIGAKVVSASKERIGRVSNLIVNENGAVEAAVIAVGGFLGMGAKDVAVTYRSLVIARNKAGDAIDHVTLAATKSELLRAAEFKSLHRQIAEAQTKR